MGVTGETLFLKIMFWLRLRVEKESCTVLILEMMRDVPAEDGAPSAPAEQEPAAAAEVAATTDAAVAAQAATENDNAKEVEVTEGAAGAEG